MAFLLVRLISESNGGCDFQKRSHQPIRAHNESLSVAVSVSNPDRAGHAVHG
jgi:hypothetical protein